MTRDEKKAEAIKRMKLADIFPQTIKQFEEDGYVSISEPPVGAFFWADGENFKRNRDFELTIIHISRCRRLITSTSRWTP